MIRTATTSAAVLDHPVQELYERLTSMAGSPSDEANVSRLHLDAMHRNRLLRTEFRKADKLVSEVTTDLAPAKEELEHERAKLRMVRSSVFWRMRQLAVLLPGLKQLAHETWAGATAPANRPRHSDEPVSINESGFDLIASRYHLD